MAKDNSSINLLKLQLENEYGKGNYKDNEKWKPEQEEKNRLVEFYNCLDIGSNFRKDFDNSVQEWIDRYEARPFFHEDGRSGVVVPLTKAIIETAQAQESKNPPSFAYSAAEHKEDEQKARILETIITKHVWYLKHVDLDRKMDVLNQDKMILGTMYQYVGYRKMKRVIRDSKRNAETGLMESKGRMEEFYDDIVVENLYPQDVWLHPFATCVADSPWIIIRKRFDYGTFLETYSDESFYKNIQYVKKSVWNDSVNYGGETRKRAGQYNLEDEVVVFEKWDVMKDSLYITANGVEIFEGPNPYHDKELPFTDYKNRLQHNTYLGESESARTATLCDAVNAFVNIAIDKEKRAGSGINLLDSEFSDFDETASIFDSNVAIRANDPKNTFVHYDMPGMSPSTDRIIQMLLDFLVFSTGIDFRQITDLSSSTKATVAALRREISQQRIQLNVSRNENTGLKRLGWLLAKRVQQFYPIPKVMKLSGESKNEDKNEKNNKKGLEYRQIRVENIDIQEDSSENGEYNEGSLKIKGVKNGITSFFSARPEYIRTKGDICVKVIPGSTIAAIQELQKNKAQEAVSMAMDIVEQPQTPDAAPKPYMSVRYFLEEWVKAMNYDPDRAFDLTNKKMETPAQDEGKDIINQMNQVLGGNVSTESGKSPVLTSQGNIPQSPPSSPPALTGQNSAPMKELADEMGPANRITNQPV